MPTRSGADDLSEESMGGSVDPMLDSALEAISDAGLDAGAAGYDMDGDGPETDAAIGDLAGPEDDELAEDELIGEPRSAEETAAQATAYKPSSDQIDTLLSQPNPGMAAPGVVAFEHVIQSFYLSAIMAMGAGTEPGQKPRIDILGARQSIDMLGVLEEKTRGNLTEHEQQLLQGITFELRMMFLELTNAISSQAHQGAPPPGNGAR